MELWLLHRRAKNYSQLPSQILRIEHPIVAYAWDKWCEMYGCKVDGLLEETKLDKSDSKNWKYVRVHSLQEALDRAANPDKQRFKGFKEIFLEMERTGRNKIIRGGVA